MQLATSQKITKDSPAAATKINMIIANTHVRSDWVKTTYKVIATVLGVSVPFLAWLAITYSYRLDKQMVVTEVVNNLKVADIAFETQSAIASAPQQAAASTSPVLLPAPQTSSLQRIRSAPSRGGQSRHSLSLPNQASLQSVGSDVVHNPLLLSEQSRNVDLTLRRSDSNMQDAMLGRSKEMKSVAKQITVRCLRHWKGWDLGDSSWQRWSGEAIWHLEGQV